MANKNELAFYIRAKDEATAKIKATGDALSQFGETLKRLSGAALAGVTAGLRTLLNTFVDFEALSLTGSAKAAEDLERQMGKLQAVINSTGGAAGITAQEIDTLARELDEATLGSAAGFRDAAAELLTFKNISGESFRQVLGLAQDISEVFGTDVTKATVQLAKALEDPTNGLTALRRVGVSFTEDQKELIASMQAVGDTAGAQAELLKILEGQIGGAAAGAGGGLAGAVDLVGKRMTDLKETLGGLLTPALTGFNLALADGIKFVSDTAQALTGPLQQGAQAAGQAFRDLAGWVKALDWPALSSGAAAASAIFDGLGRVFENFKAVAGGVMVAAILPLTAALRTATIATAQYVAAKVALARQLGVAGIAAAAFSRTLTLLSGPAGLLLTAVAATAALWQEEDKLKAATDALATSTDDYVAALKKQTEAQNKVALGKLNAAIDEQRRKLDQARGAYEQTIATEKGWIRVTEDMGPILGTRTRLVTNAAEIQRIQNETLAEAERLEAELAETERRAALIREELNQKQTAAASSLAALAAAHEAAKTAAATANSELAAARALYERGAISIEQYQTFLDKAETANRALAEAEAAKAAATEAGIDAQRRAQKTLADAAQALEQAVAQQTQARIAYELGAGSLADYEAATERVKAAQDSLKIAQDAARKAQEALSASAKTLGIDLDGISSGAQTAINTFNLLASSGTLSADQIQQAFDAALKAVDSPAALEVLRLKLIQLGKDGALTGEQVAAALEQIRNKAQAVASDTALEGLIRRIQDTSDAALDQADAQERLVNAQGRAIQASYDLAVAEGQEADAKRLLIDLARNQANLATLAATQKNIEAAAAAKILTVLQREYAERIAAGELIDENAQRRIRSAQIAAETAAIEAQSAGQVAEAERQKAASIALGNAGKKENTSAAQENTKATQENSEAQKTNVKHTNDSSDAAKGLAAYLAIARQEVDKLSESSRALFEVELSSALYNAGILNAYNSKRDAIIAYKDGVDAGKKALSELRTELSNANELIDQSQSRMLAATSAWGKWRAAIELATGKAKSAFYEQAIAAEESAQRIEQAIDSNLQTLDMLVQGAENAKKGFNLLDDQDLSRLQDAIDGANAKLREMQEETQSAKDRLAELNAELLEAQGADQKAQLLRQQIDYQQDLAEIERQRQEAELTGNRELLDILNKQQATLEKINRTRITKIQSTEADRAKTQPTQSTAGAPAASSAAPVQRYQLDLTVGTQTLSASTDVDPQSFLDALTRAKRSAA